jgi:hypothetical protein
VHGRGLKFSAERSTQAGVCFCVRPCGTRVSYAIAGCKNKTVFGFQELNASSPMRRPLAVLLAVIGFAYILHALLTPPYRRWTGINLWLVSEGPAKGLELYGGMICCVVGIWLFSRATHDPNSTPKRAYRH